MEPALQRAQLRIEPTRRQVASLPRASGVWRLTPQICNRFDEVLIAAGFSPELRTKLRPRLQIDPATGEGTIIPDASLLDAFSARDRLRWWSILASHPANRAYRWPIAVPRARFAEWVSQPEFAAAVDCLRRWAVPETDQLLFADWFALEQSLPDENTRLNVWRALIAVDTTFAKVDTVMDATATGVQLEDYWQGGGRSRTVESILKSTRRLDGYERLDLAHLLPRLPRALLHTFPPDLANREEPNIENAVAAVSFFRPSLDARDELDQGFSAWLREHCELIEGDREFGDIVVFENPGQSRWPFAMVHVADGLLFGRRPGLFGPWELLPESEVPGLNPRLRGGNKTVYRIRLETPAPAAIASDTTPQAPIHLTSLPAGPWGRLHAYPVMLSPSLELLQQLPVPDSQPQWTFTGLTPSRAQSILAGLGLDPAIHAQLVTLFRSARVDRRGLLTVRPTLPLVFATPAVVREALFPYLVPGAVATDYAQEVSLPLRSTPEAWVAGMSVSTAMRETLLSLSYRRGDSVGLIDLGALFHAATNEAQRLRLLQAVYETPVLIVLLERPEPGEVPALADYWRLDQQKSLAPLLDSFAHNRAFAYLDIIHLLPPLARETMNVFMRATADAPTPSCYWTALNFAAERPDSRLLVKPRAPGGERTEVERHLRENYVAAEVADQLGDLVVYRRLSDGEPLHLCTFVAAGVVFTKNGFGSNSPWCLMRLADVDALYLQPKLVQRVVYHRRGE